MEKIYQGLTIEELAELALRKPDDFGWWGFESMFVTWGWAGIDRHDGSDYVTESNFQVITKDLKSRFPEQFDIISVGHWAVGSVDRLVVQILIDERKGCVEENITEAFKETIKWLYTLEEYPLADESHFSDYCYEEFVELIQNNISHIIKLHNDSSYETAGMIANELLSNEEEYGFIDYCDEQNLSIHPNEIIRAAYNLNLIDEDYKDEWDEICLVMGFGMMYWEKKNEIEGQMTIYDILSEDRDD